MAQKIIEVRMERSCKQQKMQHSDHQTIVEVDGSERAARDLSITEVKRGIQRHNPH